MDTLKMLRAQLEAHWQNKAKEQLLQDAGVVAKKEEKAAPAPKPWSPLAKREAAVVARATKDREKRLQARVKALESVGFRLIARSNRGLYLRCIFLLVRPWPKGTLILSLL